MRHRFGPGHACCAGHFERDFLRLQLLADFSADPNQVDTRRRGIAFAKGQLHAHARQISNGNALARRIQPDQVTHHDLGTELARVPTGAIHRSIRGVAQPDQCVAHPGQRLARLLQRHAQV